MFMFGGPNTSITVLPCSLWKESFVPHQQRKTMTTGKRFLDRSKSIDPKRILDARTRSVLQEVLKEDRGRGLDAYLRVFGPKVKLAR